MIRNFWLDRYDREELLKELREAFERAWGLPEFQNRQETHFTNGTRPKTQVVE